MARYGTVREVPARARAACAWLSFERWLYAYRARGLVGLRPEPRSDRGFAQDLSEELRELLLDIRREHPSASVSLILDTLTEEGKPDALYLDNGSTYRGDVLKLARDEA